MATTFNIQVDMTFDDFGDEKPADFDAFLLAGCEQLVANGQVEWPPVVTSTTATTTVLTMKVLDVEAYHTLSPTVDAICNALGKNAPAKTQTNI